MVHDYSVLRITAVLVALALAATVPGGDAGAGEARASLLRGPEFRISGPAATLDEEGPDVAYGPGRYLAVWQDDRNTHRSSTDVFGRRVSARGRVLRDDFSVCGPCSDNFDGQVAVAWNPDAREYLVVWTAFVFGTGTDYDIYARRVAATGRPRGGVLAITRAREDQVHPTVAYSPASGRYLVVWQDARRWPKRQDDIYGRWLDVSARIVGPEFLLVPRFAKADQEHPAVVHNPVTDTFLVSWEDDRNAARGIDVFGVRLAANGNLVGREIRISGPGAIADDTAPSLAVNTETGQYLAVWEDQRALASRGHDIYGRRISRGGRLIGRDFRVSSPRATRGEYAPAVAYGAASDRYLVAFSDGRSLVSLTDVYAQYLSPRGRRLGRELRIGGKGAVGYDNDPAVAWNPDRNEFLVVWSDGRAIYGRGTDIYGRRLAG
jgi:hypothetical protein